MPDSASTSPGKVRLDRFDPGSGLDRGRSRPMESVWYLCKCIFFLSAWPWPSSFKCRLLRIFGATIGTGVVLKPRINIHFPWKLMIGSHSWIGEEAFILNFESVEIGNHCCISQRAFLCTGNHDFRDPAFSYRNRPIVIRDGAWVGASSFVGPGTTVGIESIVTAGSVVTSNLPDKMICSGNPCQPRKPRWPE